MARDTGLKFDEISRRSEFKSDTAKRSGDGYSKIPSAREKPKPSQANIDAGAGAGIHLSESSLKELLSANLGHGL